MALLDVKNLSHEFEYPLFNDISFSLDASQTCAIVGVSGCGKSTLLHICSTLLEPNNGEVIYDGKSLYKQKDLLKIRRYEMGIIFQSHYLFKGFSAEENIVLSNILASTSYDEELLEKLGVAHVMKQKIGELSGGQQQRISIARILSKKPKIIFADEPTGNLDAKTAQDVMRVLFEYAKTENAALFLVTHDQELAKKCDTTYELKELSLHQL